MHNLVKSYNRSYEDSWSYKNLKFIMRELSFYFHFFLWIKISTCKFYNHPKGSCDRETRFCEHIHMCDDAIHYSQCKKLYECGLKHTIDDEEIKVACSRLSLPYNQINKDLFAKLLTNYLKQSNVANIIFDFAVVNNKISNIFVDELIPVELPSYIKEALARFYEKSIEKNTILFIINEDDSFSIDFNVSKLNYFLFYSRDFFCLHKGRSL
jgi:hypothetical protein